jgi:hypothetical protein
LICKKTNGVDQGGDHYGVITTGPYYQLPKVHYSDDNPVVIRSAYYCFKR